jgi:galactose-1-phosphate uridylyltransferase
VSKIKFESHESDVKLLNPFKDFEEDVQKVEVRRDPLLGDISVYNPYLKDKVKFFFRDNDQALIEEMVRESAKNCVFCNDEFERSTPRYPADIIPEGRIIVGEAVLFPNLYPVGKYHSVIILSKAHFLKLAEFSPELIGNGLLAARNFLNNIYSRDAAVSFVAVNANYLFTAGASLVHPHLQMLITPTAYSHHGRLVEAGNLYYRDNGSCYFTDLISEERKNDIRYVAQRGKWHWTTAFAPMGNNEINAVHGEECDYSILSDSDIRDVAHGISRVLYMYESLGHLGFNYSLLSVRGPAYKGSCRCIVKIISRQNLYPNYRNDDYFLQKLLHSELIINLPEELALKLKSYFTP